VENRTKLALTAMRRILRTAEHNSKAVMQQTGLTSSQLIFLQMLEGEQEQTAGFIASRMGITQATTTALIQKLEAMGVINRRKGEQDKRQVWLSLTDKGRQVLSIAPDGIHARFHARFSELEDWEQTMLVSSLERVAFMLDDDKSSVAAILDTAPIIAPDW
jgi:MarR family transcriptional regulator, organic hydroperoxide resistance regulator